MRNPQVAIKIKITRKDNYTKIRDIGKYLSVRFNKLWVEAIHSFISEIKGRINVWTGMSRATLLPLASEIKYPDSIHISPKETLRIGGYLMDPFGVYDPLLWKDIAHGELEGEDAYFIKFSDEKVYKAEFKWEIRTYQYALHEEISAWDTLIYGPKVMMEYVKKNFLNIFPPFKKFIL